MRSGRANKFRQVSCFFVKLRPTSYMYSLGEEFRGASNIGRFQFPPCARTSREHPDRPPTLINFITDAINVMLVAVKQVPLRECDVVVGRLCCLRKGWGFRCSWFHFCVCSGVHTCTYDVLNELPPGNLEISDGTGVIFPS